MKKILFRIKFSKRSDRELLDGWGSARRSFSPRDPREPYRHADFDAACAAILEGIRQRRGFMLLTGEAGLGKTLILRRCMAEADDVRFVLLGNAHLDFPDILNYLCADLGLGGGEPDDEPRDRLLLEGLAARTSRGQAVALLVDDAHHLRAGVLRQLWDFVEASAATADQRLQVVLAGLPDIEDKLRQPELRPLWESIQIHPRLERLNEVETGSFVAHQLKIAGQADSDLLEPAALERIIHHSRGIPGAIVKLCDAMLSFAGPPAEREITPALVDEAARHCLFGERVESPEPVDLEPPIASAAVAPPPTVEASRRRWARGFLINGLGLAALSVAAVVWLWPSEQATEAKPPPRYSLSPPEPLTEPPEASPPATSVPVSVVMPPALPVPASPESGTLGFENQPILPPAATAVTTPPVLEPVSSTPPQAVPESNPQVVTRSRLDRTPSPLSGTAQPSPRARPQAGRTQSPPRAAKSRTAAKPQTATRSRTGVEFRRGWRNTVPYPWDSPAPTGFNQK